MGISGIGSDPLIYPKSEPSIWLFKIIDISSWILPTIAAALSIGSGVAAIEGASEVCAILGILGGVASALGILATGWCSRVRDIRLEKALATAQLGVNMAASAQVLSIF
jgi:hypothetical protein